MQDHRPFQSVFAVFGMVSGKPPCVASFSLALQLLFNPHFSECQLAYCSYFKYLSDLATAY